MMRSRSRWNAGRIGSSVSGAQPALAVGALGRLRREDLALALLELLADASCDVMLSGTSLAQEARAVRQRRRRRRSRPASGPRSANVARVPRSTPACTRAPAHQQRHVLARMIGARRRRIVAVIGGDDQQIVRRAAAAAAPPAARRSARGCARSRPRRCDGRRRVSKSTRLAKISPRPASPSAPRSRPCHRRRSSVGCAVEMPRPANRSAILPIARHRDGRCAISRSSSVSPRGGIA